MKYFSAFFLGKKLFGGYRIAPKICQPTNSARMKSNVPAVCMFNYECSRRSGEVVGACMDGFLFGACCQLPMKQSPQSLDKEPIPDEFIMNDHEIDHVPDIPILLNLDGIPIDTTSFDSSIKSNVFPMNISALSTENGENTEKPQVTNLSDLEDHFSALLGHEQVLNDLKLPSLISYSNLNSGIPDEHYNTAINPVATLMSSDQILQVADPVDQLPALFSHGLHQNNDTGAETILLNENGTTLDESYDPDDFFNPPSTNSMSVLTPALNLKKQSTRLPAQITKNLITQNTKATASTMSVKKTPSKVSSSPQSYDSKLKGSNAALMNYSTSEKTYIPPKLITVPIQEKSTYLASKSSSVILDATTPMTLTTRTGDDLRVPTIAYEGQSGNKKHDEFDKEEIAINHIISILNDTNDAKVTTYGT